MSMAASSMEWDWVGATLEEDIEECEFTFYALTALHFYSTSTTKDVLDDGRPTTRVKRQAFLQALDDNKDLANLHKRSVNWWKVISIATNASCPEFKKSLSAINSHFQRNRDKFLVDAGRQVRDRFFSGRPNSGMTKPMVSSVLTWTKRSPRFPSVPPITRWRLRSHHQPLLLQRRALTSYSCSQTYSRRSSYSQVCVFRQWNQLQHFWCLVI